MRNLYSKFILSVTLLTSIFSLCFVYSYGVPKALIKANILRGESFVTVDTNPSDIENVVNAALTKKGFEIVNKILGEEDIFLVDLFVYQFPAQYPAITITIRSRNGIHYIDQEYKKIFVDRNQTNLDIASELAERVHTDINKNSLYKMGLGNILSSNNNSSISNMTSIARSNYFSVIKWKDNNKAPFIIPSDLELFLHYASNYEGMKKYLQRGPIVLSLRINSSARLELVEIHAPLELDEKRRIRIQEVINSFPLWMVSSTVENIEITYGIR